MKISGMNIAGLDLFRVKRGGIVSSETVKEAGPEEMYLKGGVESCPIDFFYVKYLKQNIIVLNKNNFIKSNHLY